MCGAKYNYNTILLGCQEGDKEKTGIKTPVNLLANNYILSILR